MSHQIDAQKHLMLRTVMRERWAAKMLSRARQTTTTVKSTTKTASVTTATTPTTMAKKYRERDTHEAFLRPVTKQTMAKRWAKTKNKKRKTRGLTDKQRAT